MRLGVVAPIADHRTAAAAGAAHALGPAMLAHQREALGVIQQPREVDQFRCRHDRPGSLRAAADQRPPHSSQQKPRATATRSSAPQHPETREEPSPKEGPSIPLSFYPGRNSHCGAARSRVGPDGAHRSGPDLIFTQDLAPQSASCTRMGWSVWKTRAEPNRFLYSVLISPRRAWASGLFG